MGFSSIFPDLTLYGISHILRICYEKNYRAKLSVKLRCTTLLHQKQFGNEIYIGTAINLPLFNHI